MIRIPSSLTVGVAVTAVFVIAASVVDYFQSHEETLARLAVDILRQEPTNGSKQLRVWAVDLLEKNTNVPMPEEAREYLIGNKFAVADVSKRQLVSWIDSNPDDNLRKLKKWLKRQKLNVVTELFVEHDKYAGDRKRFLRGVDAE